MNHPIRTKLHHIADLALAFCTLEAVRLPALPAEAEAGGRSTRSCRTATPPCAAAARPRAAGRRAAGRRTAPVTGAATPDLG